MKWKQPLIHRAHLEALETPVMTGREAVLEALRQHAIVPGPEWPRRWERMLAIEAEMEAADIEEEIRRNQEAAAASPEPPPAMSGFPVAEEFGRTVPTYGPQDRQRRRLRLLDVLGLSTLIAMTWVGGLAQ